MKETAVPTAAIRGYTSGFTHVFRKLPETMAIEQKCSEECVAGENGEGEKTVFLQRMCLNCSEVDGRGHGLLFCCVVS